MPIEAIIPRPKSEDEHVSEPEEYVRTLQEKLTRAHEIARKNIKQNADYQKKYYDFSRKVKPCGFMMHQRKWVCAVNLHANGRAPT